MGYDERLTVVKVRFERGAAGARHTHSHTQTACILSGRSEAAVGGGTRVVGPGDGYWVAPDEPHALRCLEEGVVPDIFSPMRADFLG